MCTNATGDVTANTDTISKTTFQINIMMILFYYRQSQMEARTITERMACRKIKDLGSKEQTTIYAVIQLSVVLFVLGIKLKGSKLSHHCQSALEHFYYGILNLLMFVLFPSIILLLLLFVCLFCPLSLYEVKGQRNGVIVI
jgi:hypothetical protein